MRGSTAINRSVKAILETETSLVLQTKNIRRKEVELFILRLLRTDQVFANFQEDFF